MDGDCPLRESYVSPNGGQRRYSLDVEHFLLPFHWGRFCGQRRCGLAQFLPHGEPRRRRENHRVTTDLNSWAWFVFTTQLHRQILDATLAPEAALAKPNQDTIKDRLLSVATSDRTQHSTFLALYKKIEACSPADTIYTAQNSCPITTRPQKTCRLAGGWTIFGFNLS